MKSTYRGYDIEVKREMCMAGYPLVYFTVYGHDDGECLVDSFADTEDTVRTIFNAMKGIIDKELVFQEE